MPRYFRFSLLLFFVFMVIGSFAQVTVTNSGYATQSGPAIPPIPVSPPIMYAPTVHLGVGPTQALQLNSPETGVPAEVVESVESEVVSPGYAPQPGPNRTATTQMVRNRFEFGAAQFENSAGVGGVGQNINGKSLAEVAREQRQRSTNANVRVYTNTNIDQLNQTGGTINTPSATRNPSPDNWSPNNGVISPEGQPVPQSSVGGQEPPNQPTNPTGVQAQPVPKPRSYTPGGTEFTPSQPQPRTQSELRPLVKREEDEIAQNDPKSAPLAQLQGTQSQGEAPSDQNQPQASQLPPTASRLPLIGVAGLFSVTMGIFVRYQRSKSR
jgi:hypothetical protein